MNTMRKMFPNLEYTQSLYDAVTDADALVIMTEWDKFKTMDLVRIKNLMRGNILVDARNLLNPTKLFKEIWFFICNDGTPIILSSKKRRLFKGAFFL